jgi:hypothetical protein
MISHEKKLLFIHIPKTGGSSITYTYNNHFDVPGKGIKTHRRIEEFDIDPGRYYKFAVVRNPWEMCVSWHTWHVMFGAVQNTMDVAVTHVGTPHSFGIEQMDEVLRFEKLQEEVNPLMVAFGIRPRKLLRLNQSDHGDYRGYYTDRLRQIVAERFAFCIEKFGYKF